jgi:hypothetical protein
MKRKTEALSSEYAKIAEECVPDFLGVLGAERL